MGITSTGIGSGLQVEDIITKLVALEKQPLKTLDLKATALQTQISDYAQIKSLVSTLADTASKLTLDSGWNTLNASSSNSTAATAAITGIASATTFSVAVQQLAKAQSAVSTAIAVNTAVGAGTLTLQLGTWSTAGASTFTAGTAPSVDVAVTASDTMAQIAAKINTAGMGVVASVLSDATGTDRLMLRSAATGETTGFRVLAKDGGGTPITTDTGLGRLAFDLDGADSDPLTLPNASYGMGLNTYQVGQNAKAKVNGIDVVSTTNQFAGVIAGVTITASAITTVGSTRKLPSPTTNRR